MEPREQRLEQAQRLARHVSAKHEDCIKAAVCDAKAAEAERINETGLPVQLEYLIETCGYDWVVALIEENG